MAHLYRLIAFLCFLYPSLCFSQSAPVGAVDLAGWIKGADGFYSKAFTNADGTMSRIELTSAPKGISTTSTALVQTSKGITAMDIVKTANVHTARLGSSMVSLAKSAGPLGMTLTAAALVCDLTNICNKAGEWVLSQVDFGGTGSGSYSTCEQAMGLPAGDTNSTCTAINKAYPNVSWFRSPAQPPKSAGCTGVGGVSWTYTALAFTCKNAPTNDVPVTQNDWDGAASKLNDDRVTPHLIEAGKPVPTDSVPKLTPDQKKQLGLDSVPTKDSSGNVTGRQDTSTEIEAVDAGTSDNPGRVIIKETKTTINYDNSNTQISSTTSISYTDQPEPQQPQGFTISFDTVPEATLPTYNVPNTFGSTSWGAGSCPSNIDVTLTNFSFVIPTQPVCDTAEMINPFVLLISSLIGIYIIAGVRGGSAT